MILTFHMVVYFAYRVWNNYIVNVVHQGDRRGTGNSSDNEGQRNIGNNNMESRTAQEENAGRSNIPLNQSEPIPVNNNPTPGNDPKVDTVEARNLKEEARKLIQKIEFEDQEEGSKIIYDDAEPEFYSLYCPEGNGLKFCPPVYLQRYMIVDGIIRDPCRSSQMVKVVEFGCAELTFVFRYLKRTNDIREIVAVDIDKELLERHMIKLSPTPSDHLKKRPTPLNIKLFAGNVADTHLCLQGADAVIAIELIEHLYPPDLECLPFTVFGFIKPKLVIITTPNGDFNVLFGNDDPLKFRHDDHKFEWSRQQFEDWGNNLVERFPSYSVSYQGIGPGPEGTEEFGCCSQMAVFVKQNEPDTDSSHDLNIQNGTYDLVREFEFPYDERSEDQKLRDEIVGFLNRCAVIRRKYCSGDYDNEDSGTHRELSLVDVMLRVNCEDKEKVKEILSEEKWDVKTNSDGNEVVIIPDYENYDESFSDFEEDDNYQQEYEDDNHLTTDPMTDVVEDWGFNCKVDPCEDHLSVSDYASPANVVSSSNLKDNIMNHCTSVQDVNCDTLLSSQKDSVLLQKDLVPDFKTNCNKSTNETRVLSKHLALEQTDLNLSVYETPCVSAFNIKEQSPANAACKKKLSFDEDKLLYGYQPTSKDLEDQSTYSSFSVANSNESPWEVSIYSTPCGSQNTRKNVPKSLSLQQIENSSVLKLKECFNDKMYNFSDEEVKKVSRSLEGLKNDGSFEICKSFTSLSRVIDSGYPDSNSEQEMDLDLTLEQFDEIESLSDNESNSLPSPIHPVANLPHLIDDVQNGDVANNNRDGEGNNLVADMDEEPLEFEAQIHVDNEVLNFEEAVADMDIDPIDFNNHIEEFSVENNYLSEEHINENHRLTSNKVSSCDRGSLSEQSQISPVTISCDLLNCPKPTPSTTSVETTSSWRSEESENTGATGISNCLETHNSLTTVLDGCSKFSECSLVKSSSKNRKSPGKVANVGDLSADLTSDGSQLDQLSIKSVYESTESLVSNTSETYQQSSFPQWLLDLPIEDENLYLVDSEISVWDTNSYHIMGQPTMFPLDPRGGGDPQRNSWL